MNKKEIVFILTSSVNPNSIKRIDEFVKKGYKVCAYGFKRDVDVPNKSEYVDIGVVGSFKNNLSYIRRCLIIYNGIKRVLQYTAGKDCLYYLIGLDVAIFYRMQSKKAYFYEEADLVHTSIKNKWIKYLYERIDKSTIRNSILSAFRSEGFVIYHFEDKVPENVFVIANRLNIAVKKFKVLPKRDIILNKLKIGYVGFIRYNSIFNFAKVFCSEFPQHEFHFYGTFTTENNKQKYLELSKYNNCFFHGSFKSPDDLSSIYADIDLVLSTYDVSSENVRYAEPNKIYEAIYFETPIIVSSGTYLAEKVRRLGIGFDINAMDRNAIINFINDLTIEKLQIAFKNTRKIDKDQVLNINDKFFELISRKISNLK